MTNGQRGVLFGVVALGMAFFLGDELKDNPGLTLGVASKALSVLASTSLAAFNLKRAGREP
jgi:hypothetical protein